MLLVLLPSSDARAATETFHNSRHGFSISFPEGWTVMPAEKLEEGNRTAEIQHPEWKRPTIHYGYQMTNAPEFTFPPYMVIRVSDTAEVPTPGSVAAELEKDELPAEVKRDKPAYNTASNIVSMHCVAEVTGAPAIECSVVCFLTKESVIKMFFYSARADHDRFAGALQEIIENVEISERIRLGPTPPASFLGLVFALIAIGAIVVVLSRAKPARSHRIVEPAAASDGAAPRS